MAKTIEKAKAKLFWKGRSQRAALQGTQHSWQSLPTARNVPKEHKSGKYADFAPPGWSKIQVWAGAQQVAAFTGMLSEKTKGALWYATWSFR